MTESFSKKISAIELTSPFSIPLNFSDFMTSFILENNSAIPFCLYVALIKFLSRSSLRARETEVTRI
jgi:hypothetical protein